MYKRSASYIDDGHDHVVSLLSSSRPPPPRKFEAEIISFEQNFGLREG